MFSCEGCPKNCCRNRPIILTLEEASLFFARAKDFPYKRFGCVFFALDCPFPKDGRCSIYEYRPLACRRYPLYNVPRLETAEVLIGLHPDCPQIPNDYEKLKNATLEQLLAMAHLTSGDISQMLVADVILNAKMLAHMRILSPNELFALQAYSEKEEHRNHGFVSFLHVIPIAQFLKMTQKAVQEIEAGNYSQLVSTLYAQLKVKLQIA